MTKSAFGLLLENLREERKLSLRELSHIAKVDHAYIYRLETGEKFSPSEEVLLKLIRALKPGKRKIEMLRYLAKYPETDGELVKHVLQDPTISSEVFTYAASAAFRGSSQPDPQTIIERIRKILGEDNVDG